MNQQEQKELNNLFLDDADNGYLEAVKKLLGRGADIESKNIYGYNALYWAVNTLI